MQITIENPCTHCVRVADPAQCDNKQCKVWQRWFLSRWEQIHGYYTQQTELEVQNELEKRSH